MGTYGTTHVKCDDKILAFSDSYDGYLHGGMGQANLLCIKYLSTPLLRELFANFTASEKVPVDKCKNYEGQSEDDEEDDESGILSQRAIQDVVFRVKQDTGSDEAAQWMESVLSDSVRASVCGFAPLMYLNINNHYGRDYDYFTFMVDLDAEEFEFNLVRIPFAKIRAASELQIDALCKRSVNLLGESYAGKESEIFDYDIGDASLISPDVYKMIDKLLTIDQGILEALARTEEEERQARMARYNTSSKFKFDEGDDEPEEDTSVRTSGFSIRNGETTVPTLRAIVALMQKLRTIYPEYEFLVNSSDWGASDDYQSAGFRTFSPLPSTRVTQQCHQLFVDTLERQFQMRFSIFSSSGTWGGTGSDDAAGFDSLFGKEIPGPEKSMFTIDEVKNFEEGAAILEEIDPMLSLHGDYVQVRPLLLADDARIATPIIWVYMALLYNDVHVFNKVYPLAQIAMAELDQKTRAAAFNKYMQCIVDSEIINDVVEKAGELLGRASTNTSTTFQAFLKTTEIFKDAAPYMNASEKARYLA